MALHPLQAHVLATFHPGRATAVVSSEPAGWLEETGLLVTWFRSGALPDLAGASNGAYRNLLCDGGLAAVRREDLITAVFSLARVLAPGGRLLMTVPAGGEGALPTGKLVLLLESTGLAVIEHRELGSGQALVRAEKSSLHAARGLERVQSVLVQDKKFATYKLALIRALCGIARNEYHVVQWRQGQVYVPLWSIARRWLIYYWPFFTGRFVAQHRNEAEGAPKPIKFRSAIAALRERFGPGGLHMMLAELDSRPEAYRAALNLIADAIKKGPVKYAGSESTPVFAYSLTCPGGPPQRGWVVVPEAVWLDISRFHHWIEDSLILRWAELTQAMNPGLKMAEILPLLLYSPYQERDTGAVRRLLEQQAGELRCVWTERPLVKGYEVDHAIPFSVWGNNDWWNLLPSDPAVNNQKRDTLPARGLLLERREAIAGYWRLYFKHVPEAFGRQVERSLGLSVGHTGWERAVFAGFQEMVERVAAG